MTAPATPRVEESVVAPETPRVEERVVALVTARVDCRTAPPPTYNAPLIPVPVKIETHFPTISMDHKKYQEQTAIINGVRLV